MNRRNDHTTSCTFDVSYVNMAVGSIYGYAILVPLAYYFLLQYLGSTSASLIRFWCLWGYLLFILVLSSFLMIIPLEFLQWTVVLATGGASATFVYLNLKSFIQTSDLTIVGISAFVLQMVLAVLLIN